MTFDEFKAHLETLHKMEMATIVEHYGSLNSGHMMYNRPENLGENIFAYSYDGLCRQALRFNENGTVDEWCEAADGDWEHYEPHFTHVSVEEWMKHQIQAITPPKVA